MNKLKIIAILLNLVILHQSYLKADNYPTGAASYGMSGATVAIVNNWATHYNQGALGFVQGINAGVYYETNFLLPEMNTKALMFNFSTPHGTFGLDAVSYGFNNFSDNKIGLSYGLKLFNFLAMGIQLDYFRLQQQSTYGTFNIFSGEIGLLARPSDNLSIGVHVFNPWHTKVEKNSEQYLATVFKAGLAYFFNRKVLFTAEVQKDLDLPAMFKTAIEFQPVDNLSLRMGGTIFQKYFQPSFGVGYTLKNLTIDLGFQSHPLIGMGSAVSLEYKFK